MTKYKYIGIFMEDKPRYSRTSDIIELLILMQSKIQGVTLSEIQKYFNVSRRTAERMRDSIMVCVPQVEELQTFSREKRWGFKSGFLKEIISFTPEEITNLEKIKEYHKECGFTDKEKVIETTITKINALNRNYITMTDDIIEILMQSEGFAVKQMPKYKIDLKIISCIREAMKKNLKFSAKYNGRTAKFLPLGLIYGEKIYLIAIDEGKGKNPYNYLLHKFSEVKLLKETFDRGNFDLDKYAKQSFGVYQGKCYDVKLLFSKNVAEELKNYFFFFFQKIKENDDKSVIVKFKASGEYEIIWHLFKWGNDVQIISPTSLRNQYIDMLQKTLDKQKSII